MFCPSFFTILLSVSFCSRSLGVIKKSYCLGLWVVYSRFFNASPLHQPPHPPPQPTGPRAARAALQHHRAHGGARGQVDRRSRTDGAAVEDDFTSAELSCCGWTRLSRFFGATTLYELEWFVLMLKLVKPLGPLMKFNINAHS